jgi:hypothetical protein
VSWTARNLLTIDLRLFKLVPSMTRKNGNLHHLLGNVSTWTDELKPAVEDWLETYCTRDQLIKITDRSGYHHIAPLSRADPVKAVLVFDIVEHMSPPKLLTAWKQVMQEEAESAAAFDRLLNRDPSEPI